MGKLDGKVAIDKNKRYYEPSEELLNMYASMELKSELDV